MGIADRNDHQLLWYEYNTDGRLSAVYDIDNRRVAYSYTNGLLADIKDVLENHTTYAYDGKGRITAKVDAGGRPSLIAYDDYGDVKAVVDQFDSGHSFDYDYDEAKQEQYSRIRTSSGKIKEIWYDKDGEVKQIAINGRTTISTRKEGRVRIVTDEKGKITRREYDEWNNLARIVYPDGTSFSFEYEHNYNKPVRMITQRGTITGFEYDDRGNLAKKTEAVGTDLERVTIITYNDSGQPLTITIEADADTEAATAKFTYYDNGNIESITDPENNVAWFLEYDNAGNLLRYQDPRGYEWKYEYDDLGRLTSRIDPYNDSTSYEYDGANNARAVINAYLKRFEFEYDDHNNMIKAIDPYKKFNKIDYNTDNLPTVFTDREGKVSERKYDNEGRLSLRIDGAGNEIAYVYDETQATTVSSYKPVRIEYPTFNRRIYYDDMERVVREVEILSDTLNYTRKFTYDAAGNLAALTDENEKATRFEYDVLNRLTKTTLEGNIEIKRKYDNRGNLIELEDPNKGITWYEYDHNNRLTKVIRPMLQETAYEYDPNGNLEVVFDSKGQKIKYEYDQVNRITKVLYYAAGDHTSLVKTVDFTYDKLGNIKTYDDGTTSAEYSYDDLDRKIQEIINYGPFTRSHSYTYYDNGLKKTFTGPDGVILGYDYDENNRLTGAAIPGQGQTTYLYDDQHWNSPAGKMLPGGSSTGYDYDPLMQIKSMVSKDPGQNSVMTRSYQYNPLGNITEKLTEHGNYNYQYDDLQRLTEAVNPLSNNEAFTYDELDNRKTAAGIEGEWSYNANNQLEDYGDVTFGYDDNGNTTQKTAGTSEFNYIYDIEDRLVRVEDAVGNPIGEYYYDPFGRRLWKEVDGIRTYFVYSDEGLIGEYDETGAEIRGYGYVPDSSWGTDPLFYKQQGSYYWYQNDHLGAPQKILDTSGRVVWSAVYDSFGNCQIQTAKIVNNLRLPGQYFDAETGLYYNLNRYYDPNIGRYLRTDPYGEGLNLYAYVFNDPVNWIDPLGLCAVEQIVLGNFTDKVTWLGTIGQIGIGLLGIDLPGDIRDLIGDVYNWEWSWSHAGQTGLDLVGLLPIIGSIKYADEAAALLKASKSRLPSKLYSYTDEATAGLVEKSQLGLPGRTTYLTPEGKLSPIQAQIELALPQKNTAKALFEVNTKALDPSKISNIRRVTGNVFNRGGGGTEILYEGTIPLDAIKRIQ
jgi:RHS repeat-associated protein